MSDREEFSISRLRQKQQSAGASPPPSSEPRQESASTSDRPSRTSHGGAPVDASGLGITASWLPVDPARLLLAGWLARKKVVLGLILGLVLGWAFAVASGTWRAEVQLLAKSGAASALGTAVGVPSKETIMLLLKAPELVERVATNAAPPLDPAWLGSSLEVNAVQGTEVLAVSLSGPGRSRLLEVLGRFGKEAVEYLRALQAREFQELHSILGGKAREAEVQLAGLRAQLAALSKEAKVLDIDKDFEAFSKQRADLEQRVEQVRIDLETVDLRLSTMKKALMFQNPRLLAAKSELSASLLKFTEEHPKVRQLRSEIEALESEAASAGAAPDSPLPAAISGVGQNLQTQLIELQTQRAALSKQAVEYQKLQGRMAERLSGLSDAAQQYASLRASVASLESGRQLLATRQQEALASAASSKSCVDLLGPPRVRGGWFAWVWRMLGCGMVGSLLALVLIFGWVFTQEWMDPRIRTIGDLKRATRLPILASLGDLQTMDAAAQERWAFQAWTVLKGRLRSWEGNGLICGFISAQGLEGRSTWIKLLSQAASRSGYKVMTVSPDLPPSTTPTSKPGETTTIIETSTTPDPTNALAFPAQLAKDLLKPNIHSVMHLPLSGWVWSSDRRRQWQAALEQWSRIRDLVLLVELPPAASPEAVLLAETVPNVVWLGGMGQARRDESRSLLANLRHAGCRLIGAVANRDGAELSKASAPGWLRRLVSPAVLALGLVLGSDVSAVRAAEEDQLSASQAGSLSISSARKRAPWQEKLTLGPGDVLSVYLFGQPETSKPDLTVGPDGRINYLQAQDFVVTGLTVDELRTKLEEVLGKFYRSPRVVVLPMAYRSKRYYILGNVAQRGVFSLERPITMVEAIATSRGFISSQVQNTTVDMVDFGRSFLVRNGERVAVNFEGLFTQGDLSQNIPLEPDDYLYFAPSDIQEVYLLGAVAAPGIVPYMKDMTVVNAIASRGGFADKAHRQRILVVRGSLTNPERIVVDSAAILRGEMADFKLKPRDIVFVNRRPWAKAEELTDMAVRSFINSALVYWTGKNIHVVSEPFIQ